MDKSFSAFFSLPATAKEETRHAPESFNALVKLVGTDRVMMGSDYCFDMGYDRPIKVVTALKLSRADQEKFSAPTPRAYFGSARYSPASSRAAHSRIVESEEKPVGWKIVGDYGNFPQQHRIEASISSILTVGGGFLADHRPAPRPWNVNRNHQWGGTFMRRLAVLTATTVSLLVLGDALRADNALAQQKSLKEQLVGTWIYVSSTSTRADGSKTDRPNLKGIVIYTIDGRFAFVSVRDDLPKLANPDRERATAEEARAVVAGSIAYYGTYSINEVDKVITAKVEGGTYANLIGTDQKRIITSLTADELKFTNPRTPSGETLEFVWKRTK